MLRRRLVFMPVVAALVAVAVALPAASGAATAKHPSVTAGNCFCFSPASLKVKKGTKITFKWGKGLFAAHNYHLISAPKGVKHVKIGSKRGGNPVTKHAPVTFVPRKTGTYKFTCSIHTFMHLKIKVTK